ncbi:MAG: CopG family transcriptional regulator [Actinomycetota bacterium]
MARKQVLVQLDDELVTALDREAEALGVSRSELLRRAAGALIEAAETVRKDRDLVDAYRRIPQDPVETEVFWRLAQETWPEW